MYGNKKIGCLASLGVAVILMMTAFPVSANLDLEKSQEWRGSSDTVVYSTYAANVDSDAAVEILTAGKVNAGPATGIQAQLRIWNWNDNTDTLTLEKSLEHSMFNSGESVFRGVTAGDVDYDGTPEIVTVGYYKDTNNYYNDDLAIWQWNSLSQVLTKEFEVSQAVNSTMLGVNAYDIDGNGPMEIAVVGERGSGHEGRLYMFNWYNGRGTLIDAESWYGSGGIGARSVHIEDMTGTSTKEIVTGGYYQGGAEKYAQVRLYSYAYQDLSFVSNGNYTTSISSYDTEAFSVFAGGFYSGGGQDVVWCGSYNEGGTLKAVIGAAYYVSGYLVVHGTPSTWNNGTATVCHSTYALDVTGTSSLEIFAGGYGTYSSTENGQIVTFNFDGTGFIAKGWNNWYTNDNTQVWGVHVKDVDEDSTIEVLSGGQAKEVGGSLRGQLRIWHWI
jgi:hypothetical protein